MASVFVVTSGGRRTAVDDVDTVAQARAAVGAGVDGSSASVNGQPVAAGAEATRELSENDVVVFAPKVKGGVAL